MKGPARPALSLRLFPADTVVRGTYLLPGGTVVVDLGGSTLTQGWGTGSHQELMAVQSLVQTLSANFADARRVRIVVNGTAAETLAGHVSLSRSPRHRGTSHRGTACPTESLFIEASPGAGLDRTAVLLYGVDCPAHAAYLSGKAGVVTVRLH
jgi:hypothetical protein